MALGDYDRISRMHCTLNVVHVLALVSLHTYSIPADKKTISLQGIVSCIAFNPAFPDMYALGSYSKSS